MLICSFAKTLQKKEGPVKKGEKGNSGPSGGKNLLNYTAGGFFSKIYSEFF